MIPTADFDAPASATATASAIVSASASASPISQEDVWLAESVVELGTSTPQLPLGFAPPAGILRPFSLLQFELKEKKTLPSSYIGMMVDV